VIAELREGLAAAGAASERAAELHHFERVDRPDIERQLFRERMQRICAELGRGPWIEGYKDGAGIALRVGGVRNRLGLAPLSPAEHVELAMLLEESSADADGALETLITSRPREFSSRR